MSHFNPADGQTYCHVCPDGHTWIEQNDGGVSPTYGSVQGDGPLIFTPRDEFAIPTWCPSREWDDRGDCIACGHRIQVSWFGGVGRHQPGDLFAERCRPCPDHGWRDARTRDGRVVCRFHVGGAFGHCDFDCGGAR